MTSTVMLAAVRTILDEASASFWTDAEVYAALADAQNEVIKKLLETYRQTGMIKFELRSVYFDDTGTNDNISVPAGFLELIKATYDHNGTGGQEPCEILDHRAVLEREDNSYTSATATEPVAYINSTGDALKIFFLPAKDGTPACTIYHISKPTDIASGQNATLPVTTHSAIVHYAVSRMLDKDQRPQESQAHYQIFLQEIGGL